MDAADIAAWAAVRSAKVLAEMKLDEDPPCGFECVGMAIRAAYAAGYYDALVEAEPPTILDVLNREAALRAMLPT